MMTRSRIRVVMVALTLCLTLPAFSAKPQTNTSVALLTGQTITVLSDGSWLLAGGQDVNGHPVGTLTLRDQQGNEQQLAISLQFPRMWHTATVLPDGTVLILGGIGVDGTIVQQAEIFDPDSQSLQLLSSGAPAPRAFHSATLLTDGRVLIAGGIGASGEPLVGAELWDPRQRTSIAAGQLSKVRRNHSATLLSDGRVLLIGGKDGSGNPFASGELYDPQLQTFTQLANPQSLLVSNAGIAEITATSPEDGATDITVNAVISMRFSRPLRIDTVNNQTILLAGPLGMVDAKIIGAEGGMLAFITARGPLVSGTTYSVKFSGAADANNATAAFMQFGFTTAGEAPQSDTWVPGVGWMANRPTSKFQSLPPLEAAPGITALAGQALKLDGTPLQHVTLMIGDRKAFSDGTGRFLLTNIPSGHSSMMILGNTANTATRSYGIYEVGVEVESGITNVLRYVIWMTPLDTTHVIKIPSPTTSETVVASPLLPGLELHIPANTVITDYSGKPVTEISITPIPLDRPPFPLPNVQVPIYFTIQPGSAYIKVASSSGSKGARLFYPNAYGYPAGTTYNFWNYDPAKRGWYVYGQGRVSADRTQIVPNPGVEIYEFTGAMVTSPADPGSAPSTGPSRGNNSLGGDPIDLATGLLIYQKTDLMLPDVVPISLTRTYRQGDSISRAFGIGTSMQYDMFNVGDNARSSEGYTYQDVILADGGRIHFTRTSPCTGPSGYCDFTNAVYQATSSPSDWFGATIKFQSCLPNGVWTLTTKDGSVLCFPNSLNGSSNPRAAAVVGIQDRHGNVLTLTRTLSRTGTPNLTKITTTNGRWIQFIYDTSDRITQAQDNAGRTVTYSYDGGGRLTQVVDANGGVWNYSYDVFNQMLSIQDPRGVFYMTNQYDVNGRVIKQTQGDNSVFSFQYTTDATTGSVTQTDLTDPRGFVWRTTYNSNGYKTNETFALGQPEQQTITYNRDPNTNLINSFTDALSRQTSFTYDSLGNMTSVTRLAGTASAVTTSLTYEPTFSQLTSITDPLNNTTTFSRDGLGNLTAITDALGHKTTLSYNTQGLPTVISDPLSNATQFAYTGSDLVSVTDPLGNSITRFVDSAGRLASVTDALGRITRLSYNVLNQVVSITDPLQGVTSLAYDPSGNLLSLTDPLNRTTAWTYDNMDRVLTRTDPLLRQQSYTYDPGGHLVTATDRKGQVTTVRYDGLNRRMFLGFGTQENGNSTTYASTISYVYDAGNRMRQAVDSVSGTITRGYDDLDRVTSESTPQGSISYAYDNAGRRSSMTVPCSSGAPSCAPVIYTWDNSNRLTQISQASSIVTIDYDDANRRSSLALPNGVEVLYSYDPDSRLTGLVYNLGVSTLGNLTYTYDPVGHRTQLSGSFARTNLPQPVPSATYDGANELVSWGSTSPVYDPNGNMLSDGVNALSWNARNQLSALNEIGLQYDAFARRTQNLAGTSFLYDGANPVQELSGTVVTANLLNGGVDEVFSRSDAGGTFSHLRDAIGSTIALADSTGSLATAYTYDPYGATSIVQGSSSNTFQYTGRENEANGLYYYRSRYYSSLLGRFISEDPLGFRAGMDFYRYVGDDPINESDPSGLAGPLNLGQGWTARVDSFNTGGQAASEIHIFNAAGDEVGIVSGTNGWIGKHGFPDNVRPPDIPDGVLDAINGINVNQLRLQGEIGPKGAEDITGGAYLRGGRLLGVLPTISILTSEWREETELHGRAKGANRSDYDQFCHESQAAGNPKLYLSPLGYLPNPCLSSGQYI